MISKKLSLMPYAQAHVVINDDGDISLYSYVTLVCELSNDGWLTCSGTYSQTTRKHIGAFMREYVEYPNGSHGSYYDAKRCYENSMRFNVLTGEIEFI